MLSQVEVKRGIRRGTQRRDHVRFTPRQREILELCSKGLTDKEIAHRLGVSLPTVRTHLERFYRSNGLKNKAEAIAFWFRYSTSFKSSSIES